MEYDYRIFYIPSRDDRAILSASAISLVDIANKLKSVTKQVETGRGIDLDLVYESYLCRDGAFYVAIGTILENLEEMVQNQEPFKEWLFKLYALVVFIYNAEIKRVEEGKSDTFYEEFQDFIFKILEFIDNSVLEYFMLIYFDTFSFYTADTLPKNEDAKKKFELMLRGLFFLEGELRKRGLKYKFQFDTSVFVAMDNLFQNIDEISKNGGTALVVFDKIQEDIVKMIKEKGWWFHQSIFYI